MSTRAIYRFYDDHNHHAVYKHYDGYPSAAAEFLFKALTFAWPLPRYEADDMAAAFVAANKHSGGGDVRLLNMSQSGDKFDMGQEYEYEIFPAKNGQLIVRAWYGDYQEGEVYFYGRLKDFCLKELINYDPDGIVKAFHGEIDDPVKTKDVAISDAIRDLISQMNDILEKVEK